MTRITFGRLAAALAAMVGLLVVVVVGDPFGVQASLAVVDALLVLAAAGACAACGRAARTQPERRAGWTLLAVSCALWTAANVGWSWFELVRDDPVPVPSPLDPLLFTAVVLAVPAVALLARASFRGVSLIRVALDGLLIGTSLLFVLTARVLDEALNAGSGFDRVLTLSYPVLDVALVGIAVLALSRSSRDGRFGWLLLVGGLAALGVSDGAWAYLQLGAGFVGGGLVDVGWVAGYLGIALAALAPPGTPPRGRAPLDWWSVGVPYVPFFVVLGTGVHLILTDSLTTASALVGAVVCALLASRQLIATVEHHRLTGELEMRVADRTAELTASEALFRAVAENISDAVVVLNADRTVRYTSPGLDRIAGYSAEDLAGDRVLRLVHPDDLPETVALSDEVAASPGSSRSIRARVRRADGQWGAADVSMTNLVDHPAINGFVLAVRDTSRQRALESQLRHRAYHDALTDLGNRLLLGERVDSLLEEGHRPSVLLLDLDGFKGINDTLGHGIGDQVLVAVARRLQASVRDVDLVARLGGDEFAIVVDGDEDLAMSVAGRVLRLLEDPVVVAGRVIACRASIGVACDGDAADELLRNADLAMYEAKANGKARIELFHEGLYETVLRRIRLESDLRTALARGELSLLYQPVVSLATGEVIGAEALMRWNRAGESVPPDEFIPLAEEIGIIGELGAWALVEACRAAAAWQAAVPDDRPLGISVNVSARQLEDGRLARDVASALERAGLPPALLTLELTEGALMEQPEELISRLLAVKALGVRLSIDDFGTGYSSLARLQRLPFDEVKVDRAFIADLSGTDGSIVEAVVALGGSLGLEIVAEGVERLEQVTMLRERGCTVAQGFVFSRPVPADAVLDLLGSWDLSDPALEPANEALNFPV